MTRKIHRYALCKILARSASLNSPPAPRSSLIKNKHQNGGLTDNKTQNTLSKGPVLDVTHFLVGFTCPHCEVFICDFLYGFVREKLFKNLLRPLLVLPTNSCMPAVQGVKLMGKEIRNVYTEGRAHTSMLHALPLPRSKREWSEFRISYEMVSQCNGNNALQIND